MKVVIVTAIYGTIDVVKPVPRQYGLERLQYACVIFSNRTIPRSSGWQQVGLTDSEEEEYDEVQRSKPMTNPEVLKARYIKTNLLNIRSIKDKCVDFVIWIDGSIKVSSSYFVMWQLNMLQSKSVCFFKHNFLDTALEEVVHSLRSDDPYLTRRYQHEPLRQQLQYFYSCGFTDDFSAQTGHISSGIFGIRNNTEMINFCNQWWKQIVQFSIHDQLCLGFLIWQMDLQSYVEFIRLSITNSPYHQYISHVCHSEHGVSRTRTAPRIQSHPHPQPQFHHPQPQFHHPRVRVSVRANPQPRPRRVRNVSARVLLRMQRHRQRLWYLHRQRRRRIRRHKRFPRLL